MPELQGKSASTNEYNVGIALDHFNLTYKFQFELFGGRRLRGGQVLDFLVFRPFATPVQVFGEYWHTGQLGGDDKLQLAILFQEFKIEPIVIWGEESETVEDAISAVRRKVL